MKWFRLQQQQQPCCSTQSAVALLPCSGWVLCLYDLCSAELMVSASQSQGARCSPPDRAGWSVLVALWNLITLAPVVALTPGFSLFLAGSSPEPDPTKSGTFLLPQTTHQFPGFPEHSLWAGDLLGAVGGRVG